MGLPLHLCEMRDEILGYAKGFKLDPFKTVFEVIDYNRMNEVAAYGGFPNRYPHWRFGMEFERLSKSYKYGLSKIYEMVINNDPTYAYLLEGNNFVDQKTVMAHVYGHSDFFRHNYCFAKTNRKMMDAMANHGTRVRRYVDRYGIERVESFVDVCLSLDNLIDIHRPFRGKRKKFDDTDRDRRGGDGEVPRLRSKDYMDEYINPPDFMNTQKRMMEEERVRRRQIPESPEQDILQFLIEHAPLRRWQADILSLIREESYYFAPQMQTKIMNEGWATFWHSKIMTERALESSEIVDYAEAYSGVVACAPGQFNPYKIGVELFRDIEQRWNKGRFGKEWEECQDIAQRESWDRKAGLGREKIFQVRKLYNDITFIDEFLTEDFCRRYKLFTFAHNQKSGNWEIESRQFAMIKEKLLFQLTNFGQPFIYIKDANFENRAELLVHHSHQGVDLKFDYAKAVLENLSTVWSRPVNLETLREEKGVLLRFDGSDHNERSIEYTPI